MIGRQCPPPPPHPPEAQWKILPFKRGEPEAFFAVVDEHTQVSFTNATNGVDVSTGAVILGHVTTQAETTQIGQGVKIQAMAVKVTTTATTTQNRDRNMAASPINKIHDLYPVETESTLPLSLAVHYVLNFMPSNTFLTNSILRLHSLAT